MPDEKYRLGLWQKEFLARVNRIYKMNGAQACSWSNVNGFQKFTYDFSDKTVKQNFKMNRLAHKYLISALKLVKAGYLEIYEYCGRERDQLGFIPYGAPEATEAALRRQTGNQWETEQVSWLVRGWNETDRAKREKNKNREKIPTQPAYFKDSRDWGYKVQLIKREGDKALIKTKEGMTIWVDGDKVHSG